MGKLWRAAAAAVALAWSSSGAAAWREASSDHFLVYADSSESWIRGFAERLERFDAAMRILREVPTRPEARSNRLTVYVLSTETAVGRLCGTQCRNVAGFYVPRVGGSVAFTLRRGSDSRQIEVADLVLFHEYAHHFMLENYPAAYPKWFVEGFAEFNSNAKMNNDGSVQIGLAANNRGPGLLMGPAMPIETLLDPPNEPLKAQMADIFNGRAWLLTHLLMFEPKRRGQLGQYLQLINEGRGSLDAAREAFGDLAALDADMRRYLGQSRLMAATLPADRIKTGAVMLRPLTDGEAATMDVRIRSDRGVNREAALALLPDARKAAGPHADDPGAQTVLAEAEYDAGNDAEAEAAADRALAVDAKRRDALLYKGRARLRMAEAAGTRDPKVWQEARSWFVKANRNDPDAAEPLMLFYSSYLAANQPPTPASVQGLERAFELSPQDTGLRMLLVDRLIADKRIEEARAVLRPVAFNPHASPDNPARRMLARLESGSGAASVQAEARAEGEKAEGGAQ